MKKKSFGALGKSKKIYVLPGAFNAITAKLVEKCHFPGLYVSGAGLAGALGAYPDVGLLKLTELALQVQYIARAVKLPILVDVDTGFGGPKAVKRTVRTIESAGASAIQIEDQRFPKKCGHLQDKSLVSVHLMVEKIRAAIGARRNKSFLIVARTDARAGEGLERAIKRARAYLKAGADIIFPEALQSKKEFIKFRQEIQGLLLANMTEFGKTPYISVQEYEKMGYNMVIFPMTAFRVMMRAVEGALSELKKKGTQKGMLHKMQPRKAFYQLIDYKV